MRTALEEVREGRRMCRQAWGCCPASRRYCSYWQEQQTIVFERRVKKASVNDYNHSARSGNGDAVEEMERRKKAGGVIFILTTWNEAL